MRRQIFLACLYITLSACNNQRTDDRIFVTFSFTVTKIFQQIPVLFEIWRLLTVVLQDDQHAFLSAVTGWRIPRLLLLRRSLAPFTKVEDQILEDTIFGYCPDSCFVCVSGPMLHLQLLLRMRGFVPPLLVPS